MDPAAMETPVLTLWFWFCLQVLVDGTNSPPYATITVGEGATDTTVARDIAFDSNKQHMYALTGNRVSTTRSWRP